MNEKMSEKSIFEWIEEKIGADEQRNKLMRAIDRMYYGEYDFPPAVTSIEWFRPTVTTAGFQALQAVANMLAGQEPKIEVHPLQPEQSSNADDLETWLEWQFALANSRPGVSSPLWDIVMSAARYDVVVAKVDYLPFWFGGNSEKYTKKQRLALRNGPFAIRVYHPSKCHWEIGAYGIEQFVYADVQRARDIYSYWNAYASDADEKTKRVKNAVKKIKEILEKNQNAEMTIYNYTDLERRVVFAVDSSALGGIEESRVIWIVDDENDLPFMDWIVSVGGNSTEKRPDRQINPILAPMYRFGLYDRINLDMSLRESDALRHFGFPKMIQYTLDGREKPVDYSSGGTLTMMQGESVQAGIAAPVDPNFLSIIGETQAEIAAATNVSILSNPSNFIGDRSAYATANLMMSVAMSRLTPTRNVAERALSMICEQMFYWIDYTGDTLISIRRTAKSGRPRGEQIPVSRDDFDVDNLRVTCRLSSNVPTDRLQRLQMWLQLIEHGVPESEMLEDMGVGNPDTLRIAKMKEIATKTAIEAWRQGKIAEVQIELQRKAQEIQAGADEQIPGGAFPEDAGAEPRSLLQPNPPRVANPLLSGVQGEEYDPSKGFPSPIESLPGVAGYEQMTGETR